MMGKLIYNTNKTHRRLLCFGRSTAVGQHLPAAQWRDTAHLSPSLPSSWHAYPQPVVLLLRVLFTKVSQV